jgi:hypothetical protein
MDVMKEHCTYGLNIIQGIPPLESAAVRIFSRMESQTHQELS